MKPYRVKHIPTGLYFQPHKHRGSHLSKNGKIYQTPQNGLNTGVYNRTIFRVQCKKDSKVHKQTESILEWQKCSWAFGQLYAETKFSDWEEEEI